MTPKFCTITIHPPPGPPPVDMNWRILTPPDGYQWYLCWPLGKTLAEAGAPLLAGLYELAYGHKKQ